MYIIVCDKFGNTYQSDRVSAQEMLDEVGGSLYELSHMYASVQEVLKNISNLSNFNMTINGVSRSINPKFILWMEIHDTDDIEEMLGD